MCVYIKMIPQNRTKPKEMTRKWWWQHWYDEIWQFYTCKKHCKKHNNNSSSCRLCVHKLLDLNVKFLYIVCMHTSRAEHVFIQRSIQTLCLKRKLTFNFIVHYYCTTHNIYVHEITVSHSMEFTAYVYRSVR